MNYILAVIFIFIMGFLTVGCAGAIKVPELQPGDRVVIQFDRAERSLTIPDQESRNVRGS